MPTALKIGPYRLFFYAGDREEPPHVHVEGRTRLRSSGSIPFDCKAAAGVPEGRLVGFNIGQLRTRGNYWRLGMSISAVEITVPTAQNVEIPEDALSVDLSDGRTISVPLAWFPRLLHATGA